MKSNKKKQGALSIPGFSTVVAWIVVIGLGIVLLVITLQSNNVLKTAWQNTKNIIGLG